MTKRRRLTAEEIKSFPIVPRLLATSFGFGFLPKAPGTWGALLAVTLWLPLYFWATQPMIFIVTLCATIIYCVAGTWASTQSEKYWGKDPVVACADETVGQWASMLPLSGIEITPWWMIALSFVLFRLFDIFKPLGIRWFERLRGGYGMMADDLMAALYTVIILLAIQYLM